MDYKWKNPQTKLFTDYYLDWLIEELQSYFTENPTDAHKFEKNVITKIKDLIANEFDDFSIYSDKVSREEMSSFEFVGMILTQFYKVIIDNAEEIYHFIWRELYEEPYVYFEDLEGEDESID